jgi:hypothetical protein
MRKKATLRVAIRSAGIPPRLSAQAPSARPPAPPAGTNAPTASSERASSVVVRALMRGQKTGRNIRT